MIHPDKLVFKKEWVIVALTFLYLLIIFVAAWLSDDSYVTFRTIDNFIHGYGLTWNIGERVQAYTDPLWMFLLSGFYFITREIYYTSLIVSLLISVCAVLLLLYKIPDSTFNSILAALILILSKAFVDFSTSGLENPLTHLLIVLFFIVFFAQKENNKKLFTLSIIASLSTINRIDIILIFIPSLIVTYSEHDRVKGLLKILAGFLPFILWELFSLFYYGFPFPNTAYAKLNTGINQMELFRQGTYYIANSLFLDPLTIVAILAGLLIPLLTKDKKLLVISAGIFLYIIYIVSIGGDFMGGRFFSAPLLCSVIVISKTKFKSYKSVVVPIIVVVVLGLLSPKPTLFDNQYYSAGPKIVKAFRFGPPIINMYHGIVDERIWYYEYTGLLNNISERKIIQHPWVKDIKKSKENVLVKETIGLNGYYGGNKIHIIDPMALADPLLSKLPSTEYWLIHKYKFNSIKKWRIGHFARKIPAGYLETIKMGKNELGDKDLSEYYDRLSSVISGHLFSINRIKEIINFNLGKYDYLLKSYVSKLNTPDSISLSISK